MHPVQPITRVRAALVAAITNATATLTTPAGPHTPPPGAPSSTNTTLQQVEPRTDVTTLPGGSGSFHRITAPGSYYVPRNITIGTPNLTLIEVDADNVTIDLRGFQLDGFNSAGTGIEIINNSRNTTITNGSITRFTAAGIDGTASQGANIAGITVTDSQFAFTFPSGLSTLTDCHADNSGAQVGFFAAIVVEGGGTITRCSATNGPSGGFLLNRVNVRDSIAIDNVDTGFTGSRAAVTNCVAIGNANGFALSSTSTLENCLASSNRLDGFAGESVYTNCTARSNGDDGFSLFQGGIARGCRAHLNGGDGFVGNFSTFTDCYAEQNTGFAFRSGGGALIAHRCYALINTAGGFQGALNSNYTDCHVYNTGATATGLAAGDHSSATRCSVRTNGPVPAFDFGNFANITHCHSESSGGDGIDVGTNSSVSDCNVTDAAGEGIGLGGYSRVERCIVQNSGTTGINASIHTIMTDCIVDNSGGAGIDVDANSIVQRCIAENNTTLGIDADDNSIVRDSVAASNGTIGIVGDQHVSIINCTAALNGEDGISVDTASVIRDCTARANAVANYRIANDCRITGCHSDGGQFGIASSSNDNTIDSNSTVDATGAGIFLTAGGNIVTRNTLSGTVFSFEVGNDVGTIQTTPVGAGPWDNFAF